MRYEVCMARLVRELKTVTIEMPEGSSDEEVCSAAWDADDDGDGWEPDADWGVDEGTHQIVGRK